MADSWSLGASEEPKPVTLVKRSLLTPHHETPKSLGLSSMGKECLSFVGFLCHAMEDHPNGMTPPLFQEVNWRYHEPSGVTPGLPLVQPPVAVTFGSSMGLHLPHLLSLVIHGHLDPLCPLAH